MEIVNAIILGLIQGLTEFLPVSSSGHLAVFGNILNINQPGVLFETMLHAGTAFAVVWFLRGKIFSYKMRDWGLVIVGSIPAGIVGLFFSDQIEGLFSILKLVGVAFLISAFFNFQTDKHSGRRTNIDTLDVIVIGLVQAFAILPGISRSGSTIFAGTKMNLDKTKAAEFSFLLSLPAILGANIVEFIKHGADTDFNLGLSAVGFAAAFVSGIFAINFLMRMLTDKKLKYFSFYLVALGVLTFLLF
jgi:undecaprenyl-diphosphatase